MREDKNTSTASAEEEVLNKFIQKHVENLAWLDDNSENWSKAIGLAAYHLVEFGCYRSDGDIPKIASILLHAIAASGFRRNDMQTYAAENDISIDIKTELIVDGNASRATLLAIVTILEVLENFVDIRSKSKSNLH